MSKARKVILFGGQGSQHLFSPQNAFTAAADAKSSAAAAILLSRCHAVFLEDLYSIEVTGSEIFNGLSKHFISPESLLCPGPAFHDNPVIQGTTIALYQLLRYLSYSNGSPSSYDILWDEIQEAAGFCSGILAAAVVCTSSSVEKFIRHGVEAFRLALWTSFRSSVYCEQLLGRPWKDLPWSLVIYGLDKDKVAARLKDFRKQTGVDTLSIAVISSKLCISLSGPGPDLNAFKGYCSTASRIKFAHVHALYHGGEQLHGIVEEVLADLEARGSRFLSFPDLIKPLRSTLDGGFVAHNEGDQSALTKFLLRSLLVTAVDWDMTSKSIFKAACEFTNQEPAMEVDILSFGPSSNYLLSEIRRGQQHPRMRTTDVSQIRAVPKSQSSENSGDAIAIVGMAVNYPRGEGLEELWETLSQGLNACTEIPSSRFDISQFYEPNPSLCKGRKMTTKTGNFINDPWGFDYSFFDVSPREAKSVDPQSRVLLHVAHAAMEDAGYSQDSTPTFQRKTFGCYIGVATGDYTDNLRNDIDVYYSPGTLRAFLSGKISYHYKMSGPSVVIDTACSSSLTAVYQACRALQVGDCNAAIAGGVNIITSPDMYLGLNRAHFLSPTGQCKSFDASADGYSRAEGCGIFVLKRLSDAIKENDRIHGIIKGIDVSQSGNAHSITHPHPETQSDLFKRVMSRAQVETASINVVEAHGTGTQAGDFSEISSLHSVFASGRSSKDPLVVSSIKGNIGHSEAASGSAGLAKLLLMLRQSTIPKQASLNMLNPRIAGLVGNGILIPRTTQDWKQPSDLPRRALLNNFGAAGSNVALVLEEYTDSTSKKVGKGRSSYLFNVSARNPSALKELVEQHKRYLRERGSELRVEDVCYTATARRQSYEHRVSFTCHSIDDLIGQLDSVEWDEPAHKELQEPIVFVFSGQGASHFGMGKELMETSCYFLDCVKRCDDFVQQLSFPSFLHVLQGTDNSGSSLSESDQIVAFQCACITIEYALAKLWMSWNVQPDIVLGHSLGEYAALAISGAISLEDALRVVATRARYMTTNCEIHASGMLACSFPTDGARKLFPQSNNFSHLTVACQNSTKDCVVSGPLEQLTEFESHCSEIGHKVTKLAVPFGFHSAAMDPLLEPLKELGKTVSFSEPKIPLVSNVHGRLIGSRDLDSAYFAIHARQSVRFVESIHNLQKEKVMDHALFLEMGPHPITLPMVRATLSPNTCTYLPSLSKNRDAWWTLSASLRQLYLLKDDILWRKIFDDTHAKMIQLPGHPLSIPEACVPYREFTSLKAPHDASVRDSKTDFPLLPNLVRSKSNSSTFCFETHLSRLARYIIGHSVSQIPMCPASVFHELAVEAAQSAQQVSAEIVYTVKDMVFASPLVYDVANEQQALHVILETVPASTDLHFSILSQPHGGRPEMAHCSGVLSPKRVSSVKCDWTRKAALVQRQKAHLMADGGLDLNKFHTKMLYESIFSRIVDYSEDYQSLASFSVSVSSGEGFGTFRVPVSSGMVSGITSPIFTDTLLHAAGFVANTSVRSSEACICGKVESVQLLYGEIDFSKVFTVYCSLFDDQEGTLLADAYAQDSSGKIVAAVEGIHFKKLRLTLFKAMLERTVGKSGGRKVREPQLPSRPETFADASAPSTPTDGPTSPVPLIKALLDPQEVKAKVTRIITEVCEISEHKAKATTSLKSLGVDSLMILELGTAIKKVFHDQSVDDSVLMQCETIADLENAILLANGDSSASTASTSLLESPIDRSFEMDIIKLKSTPDRDRESRGPAEDELVLVREALEKLSPVVLLSKGKSKSTSLYLFHDGSGISNLYSQVKDPAYDLYGFNNPGFFDANDQPSTLVEMATTYASFISAPVKHSVILGGYSFGGVVALEAAHQLGQQGKNVKGIILIDSPYPVNHEPLPDAIIAHISKLGSSSDSNNLSRRRVSKQFQANAALLSKYKAPQFSRPFPNVVMLRSQDTFDSEGLCGVRYPWLSDQQTRSQAIIAWEKLIGQTIKVFDIPGNHFEAFALQNIPEISKQIREACAWIENK